jgi:hypothetical protein
MAVIGSPAVPYRGEGVAVTGSLAASWGGNGGGWQPGGGTRAEGDRLLLRIGDCDRRRIKKTAMIHSRGSAIAAKLLDVQSINGVLTPESIGLFVEGQAFLVSFVAPS